MSHSIRLRFVDWLHRIANKIGEGVPEALRHDQAHPDVNFATKQALAACHNRPDLIAHNAIPKFENLKPAPFFMDCDGIVRPLFCEVQPSKQAASV